MARNKHNVSKRTTAAKAAGNAKRSKVNRNAGSNGKAVDKSCNKIIGGGNEDVSGANTSPGGNLVPDSLAVDGVAAVVAANNGKDGDVHVGSKFFSEASIEVQREWSKEDFTAIIKKIDSLTDLNEFAYGSRKRIELINNLRTAIRIIADDTRNDNIEAYNSSWHDFEEFDKMMGDLPFNGDHHADILEWLHPFTFSKNP